MRKLDVCLGENKGADQLASNCEADLRLCFRYRDSTIPLLKSGSSLLLCRARSETPKTGFLVSRLIMKNYDSPFLQKNHNRANLKRPDTVPSPFTETIVK